MLEYLALECCKETGESIGTQVYLGDDGKYYLNNHIGRNGIYICSEDFEKHFCIDAPKLSWLSAKLEEMKIYSWKKAYPADYVPGKHLMGCDPGSWSFDYRETGRRNTRHICGKGEFYKTFPAADNLNLFLVFFPGFDPSDWFSASEG